MPNWKLNLFFILGFIGFIILGSLFNLVADGLDWFALNVPFGSLIVGLGFIALIMWGAIKLASAWLDKIEGK